MWKHYLKSALRSLKANRLFSLLNILGLSVAIAAGVVLLLWVNKESGYDSFHKKADRIYNVSVHFTSEGTPYAWDVVPAPISGMAKAIPGIQSTVRFANGGNQVLTDRQQKKVFDQVKVGYVDSTFLNVFDFSLLAGNKDNLLPEINNVAITESIAIKLFGTVDAIGKTVLFDTTAYAVSGVLADFPDNSSIKYDALFPMAVHARQFAANGGNGDWKTIDEDLGNYSYSVYVLLASDNMPVNVGRQLTSAFRAAKGEGFKAQFKLQNIRDEHLVSINGNTAGLQRVQIIFLIGLLILIIGSINYINLSTARAVTRSKEVGLRKIIGANRKSLFFQFVLETTIVFIIAVLVALILLVALSPVINYLTDQSVMVNLHGWRVWRIIGLALGGTLLASCIYPAVVLSSFHPIGAISGKLQSGAKSSLIRKVLVVFQFGVSFALLVCTLVMGKQMSFIKNKDLGYNKDYVFATQMPGKAIDHLDYIRTAILHNPAIEMAGFCNSWDISNIDNSTGDIDWVGKPVNSQMIIGQMKVLLLSRSITPITSFFIRKS